MGNRAWGLGYHQGFDKGIKTGAIVTLAASTVARLSYWGIDTVKKHRQAKMEQKLRAQAERMRDGDNGPRGDDGKE